MAIDMPNTETRAPKNGQDLSGHTHERTKLILEDRKMLCIDGVTAVIDYDDTALTLETNDGRLSVEGEELVMTALDLERKRAVVSGRVQSMYYSDEAAAAGGLLSRLFGRT